MDYPHGHVGHHHHNRRDDDNNNSIYPPPPPHEIYPPPPPHQTYPPPPPPPRYQIYPPPPHQLYPPPPQPPNMEYPNYHTSAAPHVESQNKPSLIGSHIHHGPDNHDTSGGSSSSSSNHSYGDGPHMGLGQLVNRPTFNIQCKAGAHRFSIAIRHAKLVLTHPLHSDLTQHWYKDEKFSTRVKDKDGHPSFMLVNKGTGQAVKHSISCHPVQLAPYKPDVMDESVLWTESKDLGSGFRTIRTVNNVRLVMDAWNADKDHGGIHDGTVIALYETWKGDNQNQQWKFVRH